MTIGTGYAFWGFVLIGVYLVAKLAKASVGAATVHRSESDPCQDGAECQELRMVELCSSWARRTQPVDCRIDTLPGLGKAATDSAAQMG